VQQVFEIEAALRGSLEQLAVAIGRQNQERPMPRG